MDPIFEPPPGSPLGAAMSEQWSLIPLRVPPGWTVVHNALEARRLPDGRIEVNDSEDLYWARTAPPPWIPAEDLAGSDDLRAREIGVDVGWYRAHGFRVVVLDPDWDHVRASHSTFDIEDLVAVLERWTWTISQGTLPDQHGGER
ncbi:hypothetical protein [Actinomadura harenae]|uniref:Uncharacterized protein n=1 Tax=Actinomadura harenae TaxID=2483351 RepID=A0A3M2LZM9_9ACTN|nr:hypothetical protein [Actinomadura harenae]RMI42954.1 hypothetical protein EBO15_18205 [Actinomadura harenae]